MRVFLSPQFSDKRVTYEYYQDLIKATVDDTVVFFDFSKVENDKPYQVDHALVTSVRRMEGTLEVSLMNYLSETETDQALLFPDWMEPEETEFETVEPIEAVEVEVNTDASEVEEPDEKDQKIGELEEKVKFLEGCIVELAEVLYS